MTSINGTRPIGEEANQKACHLEIGSTDWQFSYWEAAAQRRKRRWFGAWLDRWKGGCGGGVQAVVSKDGRSIEGQGSRRDRWPYGTTTFRLERLDDRPLPSDREGVRLFMVCRDEAVRLPWLLTYYRNLGIARFFVVDNGSEDGTRDFLMAQDDVHLFATDDTFGDNRAGTNWHTTLMDLYGRECWCLISDADELLVYPGSESLDLPVFCGFLERHGVAGLMTLTLDLYPRGRLCDAPYTPGAPFTATADAFDPGPYRAHGSHGFPPLKIRGGAQDRLVARVRHVDPSIKGPVLKRVPLIRWRPGLRLSASAHGVSPAVHLAEASGAMLHFKFLGAQFLKDRARRAKAGRGRHGVRRYRAFSAAMDDQEDLVLEYEGSLTYENSRQLLDLGLLYCSEALGRELRQGSFESRGLAALLQREIFDKQ